ncbi:MAG TPA: prolyl oligopeptidase family serine peptidase [Chloroflexota bacterium]
MIDLEALFAPPEPEELAAAWSSLPEQHRAEGFSLLGDVVQGDGVAAQFLQHRSDGLNIYGALYRPEDLGHGPFPLLLANHGGFAGLGPLRAPQSGPAANNSTGSAGDRRPFPTWCWELARAGYVVLASCYRGGMTPVGRSDGVPDFAGSNVDDVLALLACGKTLPYVDASRIGMWGTSHGGWISSLAAQRSPDLRAAIPYFPPADICFAGVSGPNGSMRQWVAAVAQSPASAAVPQRRLVDQIFGPLLAGHSSLAETRRQMIVRTPHLFAERTNCPLLLVCGDQDNLYEHTVGLDVALAGAGKEHEFRMFPGEGHGFTYRGSPGAIDQSWAMTLDFFGRRLRAGVSDGA